jgi:hypothetical protein
MASSSVRDRQGSRGRKDIFSPSAVMFPSLSIAPSMCSCDNACVWVGRGSEGESVCAYVEVRLHIRV